MNPYEIVKFTEPQDVKAIKHHEKGNARLNKLFANLSLVHEALKDIAAKEL